MSTQTFVKITKLAPRPWQAAVVAQLVDAHNLDREDARQLCWRLRFKLTAMHDAGVSASVAADRVAPS